MPTVDEWMDGGGQVDAREEKYGMTLLMGASLEGNESMVAALLQRGASVNLQSKNGGTALMHASLENHLAVVRQLLAAGADPALRDKNGKTAADLAEQNCDCAIAPTLRKAAPPPDPASASWCADGVDSACRRARKQATPRTLERWEKAHDGGRRSRQSRSNKNRRQSKSNQKKRSKKGRQSLRRQSRR